MDNLVIEKPKFDPWRNTLNVVAVMSHPNQPDLRFDVANLPWAKGVWRAYRMVRIQAPCGTDDGWRCRGCDDYASQQEALYECALKFGVYLAASWYSSPSGPAHIMQQNFINRIKKRRERAGT